MTEEQTLQQPVADAQPPVAAAPDYAAQLEAVKAKNSELIAERRKDRERFEQLQQQLADLQQQQQNAKTAKLAESGEYKPLWEEAQKTVAELQAALKERDSRISGLQSEFQQQQIRAQAVDLMNRAGVHAPSQLHRLLGDSLRLKEDGSVVALHGGVEVALQDHLDSLKTPGSGYEHFFKSSGSLGMGTTAVTATTGSGQQNPYIARNLTKIVELEATNPELAARLKREAMASRQS